MYDIITEIVPFFSQRSKALKIEIFTNKIPFSYGYAYQQKIHALVSQNTPITNEAGKLSKEINYCLLLEHTPVYTLGKQESDSDFIEAPEKIRESGAEVVRIDRGGRITFHGPGQIVMYCICKLGESARKIRLFVQTLEHIIMSYLYARFNIRSEQRKQYPGIWVGNSKIAALGISIHNRTTMHGCAINLCTDLSYFNAIVPCGIHNADVCSVESVLAKIGSGFSTEQINMQKEMKELGQLTARHLGYSSVEVEYKGSFNKAD